MERNIRGNVFDSADGIKEVAEALKDLINSQKDNIGILQIIVTEIQTSRKMSKEFLVEIQTSVNNSNNILVGQQIDEVGGIKKDVREIIELIKAKTPWFITVGAIATIVGLLGTMFGVLIKIVELSRVIETLAK